MENEKIEAPVPAPSPTEAADWRNFERGIEKDRQIDGGWGPECWYTPEQWDAIRPKS